MWKGYAGKVYPYSRLEEWYKEAIEDKDVEIIVTPKCEYFNIPAAFDIETTLIDSVEQSVMYIWQWQFGEDYTVIGRTWDEFLDLQKRIKEVLPEDRWLVVYVHNLSY